MTRLNETEEPTIIGEGEGRSKNNFITYTTCPSCGYQIKSQDDQQARIKELPGLPAGVKFDPTDQELFLHLEGKIQSDDITPKLVHHPLIDDFIPTIQGDNGICYTHPQKLPGVKKDGLVRHFFHRPSKAYTTGTRKRRKIDTVDADGGETRWHKTGKTRPVLTNGKVKGFKKILVLYTNYGKQRKPEKTNWVMHQYHLGNNEEEKDGELVVSKVFYQTQPRQCGNTNNAVIKDLQLPSNLQQLETNFVDHHHHHHQHQHQYCNPAFISFDNHGAQNGSTNNSQPMPNFSVHNGAFLSSNI